MSIRERAKTFTRAVTQPELVMLLSTALIVAGHRVTDVGPAVPHQQYAPKSAA
jgi:hypothetical protein